MRYDRIVLVMLLAGTFLCESGVCKEKEEELTKEEIEIIKNLDMLDNLELFEEDMDLIEKLPEAGDGDD